MKIVINSCYGGFGLSYKAMMRYAELNDFKLFSFKEVDGKYIPYDGTGKDPFVVFYSKEPLENGKIKKDSYFSDDDIERNNPNLIKVIEELGKEANGFCADLKIVKIPNGVEWTIEEYDGNEWVAEKHRTWS